MEKLLSICITSYNRVEELKRTLLSIDFYDDIEIIISEDCSPKREQIKEMVETVRGEIHAPLLLHLNEKNLGYDNNLGMLKSLATGKYFVYMSDDDAFVPGAIEKLVKKLKEIDVACGFTPFYVGNRLFRYYDRDYIIEAGKDSKGKYVYDSILFSGLFFKTELVRKISSEKFLNYNYFQVYLLLKTLTEYGGAYINIPLVNCISDGENAFGKVETSNGGEEMKDRSSIFATLELHKGLVKTIEEYDEEYNANVLLEYSKQYSRNIYPFMCKAKRENRLEEYYSRLGEMGMHLGVEPKIYYWLIKLLGINNSEKLMIIPRMIYRKVRLKKCR